MQITQHRLPHRCAVGLPMFITFRLHGSLPASRHFPGGALTSGKAFLYMDRLLDGAQTGPTHLRIPAIAKIVNDAIHHYNEFDYELHAWVIMPNHVHLLITPHTDVRLVLHTLKGVTARQANKQLGNTGQHFWHDESYDHAVTNQAQLHRITRYIDQDPVHAGLVASRADYQWSGATANANLPPDANLFV
jgi:REP element-mobilizing transposase RayT